MTPREHYAKAEQLMAHVAELDPSLAITRQLTAQAHVHAILSNSQLPSGDRYIFRDGYSTNDSVRIAEVNEEFL